MITISKFSLQGEKNSENFGIFYNFAGSDLAAEAAAAMAAASVVFFPTMREYSETLLNQAKDLYKFATIHTGKYSDSIHHANQAYGLVFLV